MGLTVAARSARISMVCIVGLSLPKCCGKVKTFRRDRVETRILSQGKGQRDRLGRIRRRLADGIPPLHGPPFGESLPHIGSVWGLKPSAPAQTFAPFPEFLLS